MKNFLFVMMFTAILFARDNPFVPTQTFVDEKESILETSNIKIVKRKTKSTNTTINTNIKIIKSTQTSQQIDKLSKPNVDTYDEDIMIQSKAIKEKRNVKKIIKHPVAPKIQETPPSIQSKLVRTLNPFPYIKVFEYEDALVISSQYKIKKKFMIYNPYKIAIDFKANVPDKSQVVRLDNPLFEKFVFGNHPKQGFFRVVMYPKENPHNYIRTYTDYTITMRKK